MESRQRSRNSKKVPNRLDETNTKILREKARRMDPQSGTPKSAAQ